MKLDAAQWLQLFSAFIGAGLGGVLASVVQNRGANSNQNKATRSNKLEEIGSLSVEAERYAYAEQSWNAYTVQMIAASRVPGSRSAYEELPDWANKPVQLPPKSLELENLVLSFLPEQEKTVRRIRELEAELQAKFGEILAEVANLPQSEIHPSTIGVVRLLETHAVLEKIKKVQDKLRKAASEEKRKYD